MVSRSHVARRPRVGAVGRQSGRLDKKTGYVAARALAAPVMAGMAGGSWRRAPEWLQTSVAAKPRWLQSSVAAKRLTGDSFPVKTGARSASSS
jgi:hypothetical protein